MSAVRLYYRDHVVRELKKRGCEEMTIYGTASLWKTPKGFHFIVPFEGDEQYTDEYTLREILDDIDSRG